MRSSLSSPSLSLAVLASLSLGASAFRSRSEECCDLLSNALSGLVTMPGTESFVDAQSLYYSAVQMDIAPSCRVAPQSAEDVATIVSLAVEQQCKFAVHAGGHMQALGGSNIDEPGFTIDLAGLDFMELSEDESSARVAPGLRWGDVFTPLAEKNLTVVGGRDPGVGVGGFLLGGGISFLSYEVGLGSDNIIDYEIVTASGEIVHANEQENADLWWALKMGSNNFGVITAYTLKVYPIGPLWAGSQVYAVEDSPALLENFAAYAEEANGNPEAAFTQVFYLFSGGEYTFQLPMAFRTDTPEPALYQTLTAGVEPLEDNMAVVGIIEALEGIRDTNKVRTMSYSRNTVANGEFHYDQFLKGQELFEAEPVASVSGLFWVTGVQPWPKNYFQPNNPIYSNSADETLMLLVIKVSWDNAEDDEIIEETMAKYLKWVEKTAEEREILRPFIYMNYADISQPVYESTLSPESLSKMKEVQALHDPDLVFQKLVPGGFKLPG